MNETASRNDSSRRSRPAAGLAGVGALLLLFACLAGPAAAGLRFGDFSSTAGLTLVGSAARVGNVLRLTPAVGGRQGSAWFTAQQDVSAGFRTTFQFKITEPNRFGDTTRGADGISFSVQTSGTGLNVGENGASGHLAVGFDTYPNAGDISDNNVKIWNLGSLRTHVDLHPHGIVMYDGQVHTVEVLFQAGALQVTIDGKIVATATGISVAGFPRAWVGFGGRTGGAWENHDILNWSHASLAPAQIIRVSTSGNDANNGSTWALAKRTVDAAVASARCGDQVWVAAGIYNTHAVVPLGVELYGGFSGTETSLAQRNWTANVTILDGGGQGIILRTSAGHDPPQRIDGFTIRNGHRAVAVDLSSPLIINNRVVDNTGAWNSGVSGDSSRAIVRDNYFSNNTGFGDGGAMLFTHSSPRVEGNTIVGNRARIGGAMNFWRCSDAKVIGNYMSGNTCTQSIAGIAVGSETQGPVTIQDNVFEDNGASDRGGALGIFSSTAATVSGNSFAGNASNDTGGMVLSLGPTTPFIVTGNDFTGNTGGSRGGALVVGGDGTVSSNHFSGNHGGTHGALDLIHCRGRLVDNVFTENTGAGAGGVVVEGSSPGLEMSGNALLGNNGGWTGGLVVYGGDLTVQVNENLFEGNHGGSVGAAGFWFSKAMTARNMYVGNTTSGVIAALHLDRSTLSSTQDEISGNVSPNIGAIHCINSTATFRRCRILGNQSGNRTTWLLGGTVTVADSLAAGNSGVNGSGLTFLGGAAGAAVNNTVVDNVSSLGQAAFWMGDSTVTLANNIVAFNSFGIAKSGTGTATPRNNCVFGNGSGDYFGLAPDAASLAADPAFVNRAAGDYHLSAASPCIDAGDTASAIGPDDLDGMARVRGIVDMGAYEFPNARPVARLLGVSAEASRDPADPCRAADDVVRADASTSSDADGDPLGFRWYVDEMDVTDRNLSGIPSRLEVKLPHQARRVYLVRVAASDGQLQGSAQQATNRTNNLQPVAKLKEARAEATRSGADPCLAADDLITASAGESCDADGDTLTYRWWVNGVEVMDNMSADPSMLRVKRPHRVRESHAVRVEVNDGQAPPDPATDQASGDTTRTNNLQPKAKLKDAVALARRDPADPRLALADEITADASESCDADGDPLAYRWWVDGVEVTEENQSEDPSRLKVERPHKVRMTHQVMVEVSDGQAPPDPAADSATMATNRTRNLQPHARLKDAAVAAAVDPADPCRALPDEITADASESGDADGDGLTYRWWVIYRERAGMTDVEVTREVTGENRSADPSRLEVSLPHLERRVEAGVERIKYAHQVYTVRVEVSDGQAAPDPADPEPARNQPPAHAVSAETNRTPNLPPAVFPLRWLRMGECDETSDTPAPASFTEAASRQAGGGARVSLVAAPGVGSDQAPGVFLSATAAACDPDDDALSFRFVVDMEEIPADAARPDGPASTFQTAKLAGRPVGDMPLHRLHVVVDDSPESGTPGQPPLFAPLMDSTDAVQIVDPREEMRQELRAELARLGVAVPAGADPIAVLQNWLAPKLAAAREDLNAEAARRGFALPAGFLLRRDGWTGGPPPAAALEAGEEARGEYYAALLNLQAGYLDRDDYVNLIVPVTPMIYLPFDQQAGMAPGIQFCFPRFDPDAPNPDEFDLADQLFLGDQALPMMRNNALVSLGYRPPAEPGQLPLTPDVIHRSSQNLADTARLFNAQTASLVSGVTGSSGHRHRPDTPQARVHAGVNDAATVPVVCWSFSDPHCDMNVHRQTRVEVCVDGGAPQVITDDRRHLALPGLSPGEHTVSIRVFDGLNLGSVPRVVRFRVAPAPAAP